MQRLTAASGSKRERRTVHDDYRRAGEERAPLCGRVDVYRAAHVGDVVVGAMISLRLMMMQQLRRSAARQKWTARSARRWPTAGARTNYVVAMAGHLVGRHAYVPY